MYEYLEFSKLPEALVERLANVFNSGHEFADFGVWLVREEDSDDAVELYVRGVKRGRGDVVEVCDCRSCSCECFEEQFFGVEGTLRARGEEELRKIANAIVDILRQNYGGVEALRRMGIDVIVHEPSGSCGEEW